MEIFISDYRFIFLLFLLILSAFFSGSETALFSISPLGLRKIQANYPVGAELLSKLLSQPRRLLISILFGNMTVNIAYFCISAIISFEKAQRYGNSMLFIGGSISVVLLILFGEIFPKTVCVNLAYTIAPYISLPIFLFMKLVSPFINIVEKFSNFFIKEKVSTDSITPEELELLIEIGEKQGIIDDMEEEMLHGLLNLREKKVSDIMIPRIDAPLVNEEELHKAKEIMREKGTEFVVVYNPQTDEIIGIIFVRDIIFGKEFSARKILFVCEIQTLESLLREFRREKTDIAIVVDEYGQFSGVVSIDLVLEEIVGEYETEEPQIRKVDKNTYIVPGGLNIHEWQELFDIDIEEPKYDTLAGFIMGLLGRYPKEGDEVMFKNLQFIVHKMKNRRITEIMVKLT